MDAKRVIEYALSQIGTAEDPLGSNKQKYGAMLDQMPWYLRKDSSGKIYIHHVNGFDWCTSLVDASFISTYTLPEARKMLFRPEMNDYGSVVKYAFNYFKYAGKGYKKEDYDPKPGDVIYFQNSDGLSHTGIVVAVDSTTVTTVEGNSGKNNWYVVKHTYKKTDSYIYGYGHPDYSEPEPDPKEMDGFEVGKTYEVICNDPLMIRKGPAQSYDKVGELKKGDRIVCLHLRHDGSGNTWLDHEKGWSCGLYQGQRYLAEVQPVKDGWVKSGGKWYYYKDGRMLKSAWIIDKGDKYYLGADGAMLTGWQTIDRLEYYFYSDGHMACDEWLGGYFINMDGNKDGTKGAWKSNSKGKWWQTSDGRYPKNRSVRISKKDYQFDKNGYLIT